MTKTKTVVLIIVVIILVVSGGFGLAAWIRTSNYKKAVSEIRIQEINLKNIKDGEYVGEHNVDYISAKVKVTMENHKIKKIDYIYHKNDRGEKANRITQDMISQQKIDVDAVTGATNSSKVIKKAVENALT